MSVLSAMTSNEAMNFCKRVPIGIAVPFVLGADSNRLGFLRTKKPRYDGKAHVDACRNAGRGEVIAIFNPARLRLPKHIRPLGPDPLERCLVRRCPAAVQQTRFCEKGAAGADACHQFGLGCGDTQPFEKCVVFDFTPRPAPTWHNKADIPQMTSKFAGVVLAIHRHGNSVPFVALRCGDFGGLIKFGTPFGKVFHHLDAPLPSFSALR